MFRVNGASEDVMLSGLLSIDERFVQSSYVLLRLNVQPIL